MIQLYVLKFQIKIMGQENLIEEFDNTTPTTQITFQVITEGFVTKKKFTDVQLNIKKWQEVTKLSGGSDQLNRILSMLTGSH